MIENNKEIEHCKWRSLKAVWAPVLLAIVLGIMAFVTLSEGLKTADISFPFIALSATLGIMTVCVAYLILKKGRSRVASGILILLSLGTFLLIIPGMTAWSLVGMVAFYLLIGLPISLYWNKVCKKTSG